MDVADGTGNVELRGMAVCAPGRSGQRDLLPAVLRWTYSTEARIQEATTVILADFQLESIEDGIMWIVGIYFERVDE